MQSKSNGCNVFNSFLYTFNYHILPATKTKRPSQHILLEVHLQSIRTALTKALKGIVHPKLK